MRLSRDVLMLFGAAFTFALMAVFSRASGAPILTVSAWRAVFVAISFGVWALALGGPQALLLPRPHLIRAVIYGVAVAVASSTYVGGFTLTTVANTVFFHALAPVFVFPLARWRFGEKPSGAAIAGTAIAVAGVGLLSGVSIFHIFRFTDPRFLLGDFLAFVSAIAYAAVLVATREARTAQAPIVPMLAVAWSVAAVVLIGVAGVGGTLALPLGAVPWVLALALVSTTLPFYLLNVGMAGVTAGIGALIAMSEVVFATVLGVLVYGEWPAPIGWLGGALLVLGIAHPLLGGGETREETAVAADPARLGRLGLRLVLLNGGALLALLGGDPAGHVLAWAAVASTLGLGLGPAQAAAGARYSRLIAVSAGVFAVGVLGGLYGAPVAGVSPAAAVLAALVFGLDRVLSRREAQPDPDVLGAGALLLVAGAGLLAQGDHPGATLLDVGARVLVGGAALRAMLSALGARTALLDAPPVPPRLLAGALAVVLVGGGVRMVPAGHVALVQRFGEPLSTPAPPGLLIRLPPPIETVSLVNVAAVRAMPLAAPDTAFLCGDQTMVTLSARLLWTIADPAKFLFGQADPEAALAAAGRSALANVLARAEADRVLTAGRAEIEAAVAARAQLTSTAIGVKVEAVELTRVAPPTQVLASFLEVVSAEEHKRKRVNEAEAYAAQVLPRARGEAAAIREAAMGRTSTVRAEADADVAWLRAAAGSPGAREVFWRDSVAAALAEHRLVLVPRGVEVWVGGSVVPPAEVR